jgi:hypothetical protein
VNSLKETLYVGRRGGIGFFGAETSEICVIFFEFVICD